MSNEENKALVSLVYDLFKRKEIDAAYEHFTPECVFHMPQGNMSVEQCISYVELYIRDITVCSPLQPDGDPELCRQYRPTNAIFRVVRTVL